VQNQIAVRQFIVISFGNPENVHIFGREGQDPPLQILSYNRAINTNLNITLHFLIFVI